MSAKNNFRNVNHKLGSWHIFTKTHFVGKNSQHQPKLQLSRLDEAVLRFFFLFTFFLRGFEFRCLEFDKTHVDCLCAVTIECVMARIWISHGTHMHASLHTYKRVVLHTWMSVKSCYTYEWVMSHMWKSHGTCMNESYHTYEWVMSHIWMSHVTHTHMNASLHL